MARPRRPGRTRSEARLDPIRWRRPGRGATLRLAVVAALLITAALIAWSGPATCSSKPTQASGSAKPTSSTPAAESPSSGPGPGPGANSRTVTGASRASPVIEAANGEEAQGPGRAAVPTGTVGVPVRLAEPTALALVRPGDHVDLFRVGGHSDATAVAAAALVLDVTGADDPTTGGLLLALTPAEAARTFTAQGGFAVLIRP